MSNSADLNKKPEEVSAMFDGVAARYDIMNDLLSFGQTKTWRKVANTTDFQKALQEALRVTKVGGRIVVVEFSHPTNPIFRNLYMKYLMGLLPKVARKLSSNPDAYIYLAQSIQAWPNQVLLAEKLSQAGWKNVAWQNLTFGIVAIHIGYKESS